MKDLKGIKGKYYIASLIEEGEHERQDFKFAISDGRKIARSISAFANHSGGRLLIGVKDNGVVAGVPNDEDIYLVEQAAELHCVPPQEIKATAFKADGGLTVVRIDIAPAQSRPVFVREAKGELKAYFRVKDENIVAHPLMVRAWQRAADQTPAVFSLDSLGRILLELASRPGGTDESEFMLTAHISRLVAEETVVRMATLGLVEFKYNGSRFVIVATTDTDTDE